MKIYIIYDKLITYILLILYIYYNNIYYNFMIKIKKKT